MTRLGSMNSHTAILERTMNNPALIGVEIDKEWHGKCITNDAEGIGLFRDFLYLEANNFPTVLKSAAVPVTSTFTSPLTSTRSVILPSSWSTAWLPDSM